MQKERSKFVVLNSYLVEHTSSENITKLRVAQIFSTVDGIPDADKAVLLFGVRDRGVKVTIKKINRIRIDKLEEAEKKLKKDRGIENARRRKQSV